MEKEGKVLLQESQVAEFLGVAVSTVRNWRVHGRGPDYIRLPSGSVRYRPDDLERWVTSGQRKAG